MINVHCSAKNQPVKPANKNMSKTTICATGTHRQVTTTTLSLISAIKSKGQEGSAREEVVASGGGRVGRNLCQ